MINLFLLILFFSICIHIRVLSFIISPEEGIYNYNPTVNEINGVDQNWINMKNVEKNVKSSTFNEEFEEFQLTNLCHSYSVKYENVDLKFNNMFVFSDNKCFNATVIKDRYLTEAISDLKIILQTEFSKLDQDSKEKLGKIKKNIMLHLKDALEESSESIRYDMHMILNSTSFYKNLHDKFLHQDESFFQIFYFANVVSNFGLSSTNCFLQSSNVPYLFNLSLGKFSLFEKGDLYCFKINYGVPILCHENTGIIQGFLTYIREKISKEKNSLEQLVEEFKKLKCSNRLEYLKNNFFNFKNIIKIN